MARSRSVRMATAVGTTVCLLLLLLAVTATTAAGAHLKKDRDSVEKSGGSPIPMVYDGPSGQPDYHALKDLIEKERKKKKAETDKKFEAELKKKGKYT